MSHVRKNGYRQRRRAYNELKNRDGYAGDNQDVCLPSCASLPRVTDAIFDIIESTGVALQQHDLPVLLY